MTSAERLQKLFKYDLWANNKVLHALETHAAFQQRVKAVDFLNHIIGTHHHWFHRVTGTELPDTEIWPEFLLGDCQALIEANYQRWSDLIEDKKENLDTAIHYQNSKGVEHESLLSDVMHHMIIHGQHHRSQIALLMRMAEIDPPATDFIFYCRQL